MTMSRRLIFGGLALVLGGAAVYGGVSGLDDRTSEVDADAAAVTASGKKVPIGVDPAITSSIEPTGSLTTAAQAEQNAHLTAVLKAVDEGDINAAFGAARSLDNHTVTHDLADWAIAMSGDVAVPASHIATVRRRLAAWPGQDVLERNHERALIRGGLSDPRLRSAFRDTLPATFEARYALAKARLDAGQDEQARALIAQTWRTEPLAASVEREIGRLFADLLTPEDHRARYFNMMVRERLRSAEPIAVLLGIEPLHRAWAAVLGNAPDAGARIAQVPQPLLETQAGRFMQVEYLRRAQRFEEAAQILFEMPADPGQLTNADAWWNERRIVSRSLREAGDIENAYALVAAHKGGSAVTRVDAAFHAGWYALQGLGDPALAATHFAKIEQIARGASSQARGAYWLGRTAEAAGDQSAAQVHYRRAAAHRTVFYGQLAAQALGQTQLALDEPSPDATTAAAIRTRPAFAAIQQLQSIGHERWLPTLYRGLAEQLAAPEQIVFLARHAADHGQHSSGLRIAKRAAWKGVDIGLATHPVGAIPGGAALAPADRALAYAIARQESEFDTGAVSRADARGLLQLLPSTARRVAGRLDLPYSTDRLTADPAFNALLGTQYLDEQRDDFGGSYILTFVAYNAGPARARQWIDRFGDPRGLDLEATIDWIEQIPFPETRFYVQRVMENLTVYKARFGMELDISGDLTNPSF